MSDKNQNISNSFSNTLFSLLGYVAKCDGQITRNEVKRLQVYIKKMNLSEEERQQALQLFKLGTLPTFNIDEVLETFSKTITPKLIHILLVHLITMARADGYLVKVEMEVIQKIARGLGYRSIVFNHLLRMISVQDELSQKANQQQEPTVPQYTYENLKKAQPNADTTRNDANQQPKYETPDLQQAYEILGVKADMTEDEIRRAYKKLASQLHPDKLASQGLAPDATHVATERFKKVQIAYAFIKKYRSIYAAS